MFKNWTYQITTIPYINKNDKNEAVINISGSITKKIHEIIVIMNESEINIKLIDEKIDELIILIKQLKKITLKVEASIISSINYLVNICLFNKSKNLTEVTNNLINLQGVLANHIVIS